MEKISKTSGSMQRRRDALIECLKNEIFVAIATPSSPSPPTTPLHGHLQHLLQPASQHYLSVVEEEKEKKKRERMKEVGDEEGRKSAIPPFLENVFLALVR